MINQFWHWIFKAPDKRETWTEVFLMYLAVGIITGIVSIAGLFLIEIIRK